MGANLHNRRRYGQPVRICAYLRLSHDRTRRAARVEEQRQLIMEWAAREGVTIDGWFVDNNTSAAKIDDKRKGYPQMMTAILTGEYQRVVAVEVSRLSREDETAGRLVNTMRRIGGQVTIPGADHFDFTDMTDCERYRDQVREAIRESARISIRITDWHERRHEQRRFHGGQNPYGYRRTVELQLNERGRHEAVSVWALHESPVPEDPDVPSEPDVIRECARRVRAGETLYQIATDLNRRGIPTRRQEFTPEDEPRLRWSTSAIRRILENPRVAGMYGRKENGRWQEYPQPEGSEYAFPAILDHGTWLATVDALGRVRERKATRVKAKFLSTGFFRCSECSVRLIIATTARGQTYIRHPLDAHGLKRDKECSVRTSITLDDAERFLGRVVSGYLKSRQWEKRTATPRDYSEELAGFEVELEELADKIDRKIYSEEMGARLEKRILDRRAKAQKEANAARATAASFDGDEALTIWTTSDDLTARRRVLALVIDYVTVTPGLQGTGEFDPERLAVTWRKPRR